MSTLKADAVTTKSDNTDLTLTGGGTGVPNLEAGFKVGGSAGVPTASIQTDAVTTAKIDDAAVTTAKINDDAVTLAKLAAGTDGELITWDASGDPATVAVGTATHILTSNGVGAAPTFQAAAGGGFTLATPQATTSGTSVTFSSIPAGTTQIVIQMFGIACTSSSSTLNITIGDSGGLETTGYYSFSLDWEGGGSTSFLNATDGFKIGVLFNDMSMHGQMVLSLQDATNENWTSTHAFWTKSDVAHWGGGGKSLSGELTQLNITQSSAFTAGSINIMYM